MGLAAALIVPATPSKAADMEMGGTKITIGGQLRERLEWDAATPGSGDGSEVQVGYRARIKIKAELADGVSAVFVPQAYGTWGENGQGLGIGEKDNVGMHEAYMLLSNPFGINNVIVKLGRQEVNLGNQRLVGAVDWTMQARSIDGILLGYVAGDYGLAGFFYGKLNSEDDPLAAVPVDVDLYVATWQGNFKPFGIGGTYEITDIFVQPVAKDLNVNTLYGRVTPVFDTDMAKIKVNLEFATQSGDAGSVDFSGYFYSIGAGATFTDIAWKPSISLNYDYYSGDDDNSGDIDTFWAVLPTAHKWTGHADVANQFISFNGTGLLGLVSGSRKPGLKDLYAVITAKPTDKLALYFAPHYFQAAEDGLLGGEDDIGWETDLEASYKYSKNLCLKAGWYHFDPDDGFKAWAGDDESGDHFYLQADLKF